MIQGLRNRWREEGSQSTLFEVMQFLSINKSLNRVEARGAAREEKVSSDDVIANDESDDEYD